MAADSTDTVELVYSLSRGDKRHIFLKQYYAHDKWLVLRKYGGPSLILMGIVFHVFNRELPEAYGWVLITIGFYYLVRPWLLLRTNQRRTTDEIIQMQLRGGFLNVKTSDADSKIDTDKISDLKKDRDYISMKINLSKSFVLMIPLNRVLEGSHEEFWARLSGK